MKNVLGKGSLALLFGVGLFLGTGVVQSPAPAQAAPGLTAGYALDQGSGTVAADASGNNLNGTLSSGATWTSAGKYNSALSFNGANNALVNLGNPAALNITGSLTISAWINSAVFPGDDAAIVSKRTNSNAGYQLDTTIDKGPRTIGFKLNSPSGAAMYRYGATAMSLNTWYYVTGVYDASAQTLNVYLNGVLDNGVLQGTVATSQGTTTQNVNIGKRAGLNGFSFNGKIDEVRIYNRALSQAEIQADMNAPLGGPDTTAPTVSVAAPANNATVSGSAVTISAAAGDNVGVVGVQFKLDGNNLGAEDTTSPYSLSWNSIGTSEGVHQVNAVARDAAGNSTTSTAVNVIVDNIDETPPTVSITAPANNATVAGTLNVTANASDNIGVAGVQFKLDGANLGSEDTVSPYTVSWNTVTASEGPHQLTATARDAAGNSITSSTVNVTVQNIDTVAPTAPANLTATAVSSSQINLSWTASTDNVGVTGYHIESRGPGGSFVEIATVTTTTYSNINLSSDTAYVYRVRAEDAADNHSAYSAEAGATTLSPSTGLAAAYALNENAGTTTLDASGNANTGTLTGAGWTTAGKYGNAVTTAGNSNSYVNLGNNASLQLTGSMTIEAWIYSTSFPGDDASIVSKRNNNSLGYQLDTTVDRGPRTIGFKLTNSSGTNMIRYGQTAMQTNTWYHIAGVYNASAQTMSVYLNGVLDNGFLQGTVTATQQNSPLNVILGKRSGLNGFEHTGRIDEVRIYSRALTQAEIQADMNAPLSGGAPGDTTPPTISITSPANSAQVNNIITVTANAADNVGVAGVQFYVDGNTVGAEDVEAPYGVDWDSRTVNNGSHVLTARARDAAGNNQLSTGITVNVTNSNFFQNEILATNFDLPTNIEFLPDGRMLVGEVAGLIKVLPPPYTTPDATPFLDLDINIAGYDGLQQGIFDIMLDPNFATNRYYYVFYTQDTPRRDRLSRFTANVALNGTVAGSEVILYQDPQDANSEHHGGAINFGNDGKIYFTTGEHFNPPNAQNLTNPRGKVHRINPDGTIPTDNPFYDGAGPNVDSIWAYGLRNPFRAYYDSPTGRLYIADVGGNDYSVAREEVNLGVAGANYGWPNSEGNCSGSCTSPIFSYGHNGRDASITGGFVYRGTVFPAAYQGNYFYADYAQNWIRRLTLDASGNVTGSFNFEPINGSLDGPYGDVVYLTEGPDGALYYVDLGYSDIGGTFGVSKIRRIRYVQSNQPPVAVASANPVAGPKPLTVNFSSAGSSDPESQPITYAWTFGDGGTSTEANPSHVYTQAGPYTARLTVSDSVNSTLAPPLSISVGVKPVPVITSPVNLSTFRAGDVISFSGSATDAEDGTLAADAYRWNIDFLHAGHVHPVAQIDDVISGTFPIATSGHDFSGDTRYRFMLTVTDSDGLQETTTALVYPEKVNLSFATVPAGLTVKLDGISNVTPFTYDTLIGFTHTIEAADQQNYTFVSWSDGGAQSHAISVPTTNQTYTATFQQSALPGPVAAWSFNEGSGATAADATGNSNTTALSGPTWVAGQYGSALSFDGVNDFGTVADSNSLDMTGSYTLSAWVRPTTLSGYQTVISKEATGNLMGSYYLQTTGDEISCTFYDGSFREHITASANLQVNTWYHVTCTFDTAADRFQIYVNGVLAQDDAETANPVAGTADLVIGQTIWGERWNGLVDNVRIYSRALTLSEVQTDMNTGL